MKGQDKKVYFKFPFKLLNKYIKKDDKITEIHLRSGNDICLVSDIGDEIYPVWQGEAYSHMKHLEFIPNLSDDEEDYTASGNLKDVRLGYYKKKGVFPINTK